MFRIPHTILALGSAGALVSLGLGLPASTVFAQDIPAAMRQAVSTTAPTSPTLPPGVTALYGANEWATAAAVAHAEYPQGTHTAIITSGLPTHWVDALTAAPLATALHAPILLSATDTTLGTPTLQALESLGVTQVYLIGVVGAPANATALTAQLPASMQVTTISGATEYGTAGFVAQALAKVEGITDFSHVFVTSGVAGHIVDALAADPIAATQGDPILLVPATGDRAPINPLETQYLNHAGSATIVGAAQAYSYAKLPATVTRTTLYGQNRAGTATAIDTHFAPASGYHALFITNGTAAHLVDALTAGPLMALNHAAMVEVYNGTVPPSTTALLHAALLSGITNVTVVGGPASIPSTLYASNTDPLIAPLPTLGLHPVLTAQASTVAQGTADPLTLNGVALTPGIAWTITGPQASTGLVAGDGATAIFVGTAPGTYTIQAAVAGTIATTTVTVYNSTATGFSVTAANSSLVADGLDTTTVTIQATDLAGTPIPTWNGTIRVSTSPEAEYTQNGEALPAGPTANTALVALTHGSATITVGAVAVPGISLALALSQATAIGDSTISTQPTYGTTTITTVLPVATALQWLQVPHYLASNVAGTTTGPIAITVVDQAGHPMLTGVTPITVHVAGSGTLVGGVNDQQVVDYNGSMAPAGTPNQSASVTVGNIQGATGFITLTASATGLASSTADLTAIIAGVPTQVVPTLAASSMVTNATSAAPNTLTLQAEDATGVPVAYSGPVTVTVTPAGSPTPSTTVQLQPIQDTTPGTTANTYTANAQGTWTFAIADANAVPGTYTVTVAPVVGVFAPPAFPTQTIPLTITAGTWSTAQFISPTSSVSVAASDPTDTYTVQLTDAGGHPVAQAGVTLNLWAMDVTPAGTPNADGEATLNGLITSMTNPVSVTTNAQGQASVTLVAIGIPGAQWQLAGTIPVQVGVTPPISIPASPITTVAVQVPASIHLALTDTSAGPDHGSTQYAIAGNTVDATVRMQDQYGIPLLGPQSLTLTIPAGLSGQQPQGSTLVNATQWVYGAANTVTLPITLAAPTGSLPVATVPLTAWSAGPATLTATTNHTATRVQGAAALFVQAGTPATAGLFVDGTAITTLYPLAITANLPIELTVVPTDTADNPTTATYQTVIALNPGPDGSFRLTPDGAAVTTVTLTPGTSGTPVYYVSSQTGSVTPTATLAAQGIFLIDPLPTADGMGTVTLTPGASTSITATVYGSAGTTVSLAEQAVTASVTGGGTLNMAQGDAAANAPSVTFLYTAPTRGSGTAVVTLEVPGQGTAKTVLTRTVTITY